MSKRMKKAPQPRVLSLKGLDPDHFLSQLYNSTTFKYLKIELEGNQDSYYVDMSDCDCGEEDCENEETSELLREVLDRADLSLSDFTYIYSYNDGSVNTEITFTVPLTPEGVDISKRLMAAFGGVIDDTRRAGMHIAVMPDSPYGYNEPTLTDEGIKNLEKQLGPILPWIQILTQNTSIHRGAGFCGNFVGHSKQGYPAVYIQDRKRIEFRFFHPCYYNTGMLDHYLEVIARMLEYYDEPTKKVVLHGGTGTYRHLLGTEEFNAYIGEQGMKATKSLAFSDIFYQFTGKRVAPWLQATGFQPLSLQQHWCRPEYRTELKGQRELEALAQKRLKKQTAKWLTGDKRSVYDTVNMKTIRSLQ